jgi:hypothetical protein
VDNIFVQHPNLEQYFKTADGQAFYEHSDAKLHTKSLDDKSVETINRPIEVEKEVVEENTAEGKQVEENTEKVVSKKNSKTAKSE